MKSTPMTYRIVFPIILMLLVPYGCATTKPAIVKAASNGDINTIKSLSDAGQSINECDSAGTTALMYAIKNKQTETAKYLIESGADLKAKDKHGFDALIYTAEYSQIEIMKLLINNGADVDSRDLQGNIPQYPPLYFAILQGFTEGVKLLVKNGANIYANINEDNQKTILDYALYHGQMDVAASIGAKLWEPDAGKARIFLISEGLYDYVWVKIGDRSKYLNRSGFGFIDVEPGLHAITVDWADSNKAKPALSVDIIAGQIYYFQVTQLMGNRILGYVLLIPTSSMDQMTGTNPFSIIQLMEVNAKEKIKSLLQMSPSIR